VVEATVVHQRTIRKHLIETKQKHRPVINKSVRRRCVTTTTTTQTAGSVEDILVVVLEKWVRFQGPVGGSTKKRYRPQV